MIAAVGGGSDKMKVAPGLACVMNSFVHVRADAAGCAVMAKYPTAPLPRLLYTDAEEAFMYQSTSVR